MRNALFVLMGLGSVTAFLNPPPPAYAQVHHGHSATLYVAALDGQQVVPAATTDASGTGAFTLKSEGGRFTLAYDLTYQGLPRPARRIVLRNFGQGGVGKVVHVICGGDAGACPPQPGATLKGEWTDRSSSLPLTAELAREATVGRVYAEIEDEAGQGVVRGQIVTYDSMLPVQAFVSRLRPASGVAGAAASSGTGAFYLSTTADGGQVLAYHVTAAGTEGAPNKALIVRSGAQGLSPAGAPRALIEALPQKLSPRVGAEAAAGERSRKGGTIAGATLPPPGGGTAMLGARALMEAAGAPAAEKLDVIIATDANPNGELIGELTPVQ